MVTPYQTKHQQGTPLIRPEQRLSWIIPYACCSVILLSGCVLKTDEIDYGETGKLLTEEEVLASNYIDREAIHYQEGDRIKLYYVKDGEVYYQVDRVLTDQELQDRLNRYQSIAGIFGRLYKVGVGQRYVEGEDRVEGVSYFDFEEGNATAVDYFKTDISYREENDIYFGGVKAAVEELNEEEAEESVETQKIEAIQVEFAFTVQEGNGLFELTQYPAVLDLLNALREVNLSDEEIRMVNEQVQAVMMGTMMISEAGVEPDNFENQVVIERDAFTEMFQVTPEAPHQVIFTMTLTDLLSIKTPIPDVE